MWVDIDAVLVIIIVKSCDTNDKSYYILWNNSEIKQENKTWYRKEWHDKGINYIHHLYEFRVNKFYSFPDFKLIYDINDNDFLIYTSLIKQIPLNIVWALDALFLTATRRHTILTDISSVKQACKLCYSLQLKSNVKSAIPSRAKWSRIVWTWGVMDKYIYIVVSSIFR